MTAGPGLPFVKMEGCGNDYVYVDLEAVGVEVAAIVRARAGDLARAMSDRHRGIGSDGLILIGSSGSADATMHVFNADGSRGATCGNGLRCVATYLAGTHPAGRETFAIETDAGVRSARLEREGGVVTAVEVGMGVPEFSAAAIPLYPGCARVLAEGGNGPWHLATGDGGDRYEGFALSMGNPHFVVRAGGRLEALDLGRLGPLLEHAPCFPDRANVEFVELRDGVWHQRTWERGSGETLACGSGACATGVAAVAAGLAGRGERIDVHLRGGVLGITWTAAGEVRMRGPARIVFRGVWTLDG